jgi:diacylglycerol kinase (ATP)
MQMLGSSLKVKVIFNPTSGRANESPQQLTTLLACLQNQNMIPEVHIVQPGDDLAGVAADAARKGFELVVVSGGDGTISSAANGLIHTSTSLGIIPTGTQNNQALAFGIPLNDLEAAVLSLRQGEIHQVDTGLVRCRENKMILVEIASIGLTSALFPSTDDIQHGEITKLGEFIRILLEHPLMRMEAELNDGEARVEVDAHTVLVTNMPYTGAHWRLAEEVSFDDGLLDVFFFPEMSKIDLINTVLQVNSGVPDDDRVWHYQVRNARFHSRQPAPVMVDGVMLESCDLAIEVQPHSLRVVSNLKAGGARDQENARN